GRRHKISFLLKEISFVIAVLDENAPLVMLKLTSTTGAKYAHVGKSSESPSFFLAGVTRAIPSNHSSGLIGRFLFWFTIFESASDDAKKTTMKAIRRSAMGGDQSCQLLRRRIELVEASSRHFLK